MIKYIDGDATLPVKKPAIICHVCNSLGLWGKGFVLALSKKYEKYKGKNNPEYMYKTLGKYNLGHVQFVEVNKNIIVANMIAQEGIKSKDNLIPIRYDYLNICLKKVYLKAKDHNLSIHMPKIGAGLAGGDWSIIINSIKNIFYDNIEVYIYSLNGWMNDKDFCKD